MLDLLTEKFTFFLELVVFLKVWFKKTADACHYMFYACLIVYR